MKVDYRLKKNQIFINLVYIRREMLFNEAWL